MTETKKKGDPPMPGGGAKKHDPSSEPPEIPRPPAREDEPAPEPVRRGMRDQMPETD